MTRKDFILIASTIKDLPEESFEKKSIIAARFATKLATTNPNFDRLRFMEACLP